MPRTNNKDAQSHLRRFSDWMAEVGLKWWQPNLERYFEFLIRVGGNNGNGLHPRSARAHLSSIRGHYRALLRDKEVTAALYNAIGERSEIGGIADAKAVVDEIRAGIINAIDPSAVNTNVLVDQDPDRRWLTDSQIQSLLSQIDQDTRRGLRDYAAISIMLVTGVRVNELTTLRVRDLYATMDDGTPALRVWQGKGHKARKVPYGDNADVLGLVERWLTARYTVRVDHAKQIPNRRVFPVSTRTIQRALEKYPVANTHGDPICVRPHDLRRTHARRAFLAGMDPVAIMQNLGHRNLRTTMNYIGDLDGEARKPPRLLERDDNE